MEEKAEKKVSEDNNVEIEDKDDEENDQEKIEQANKNINVYIWIEEH